MARLVLWGIQNYCGNKDDIADLYDEVSEQLEMSRKTLQNYASVARRFPQEDVFERLEIGHHITVVAMPDEVANFWLSKAESNGWSVQRLRQEIRNMAQTPSEDDDDEDADAARSAVMLALARYGINAVGDDKTLSMGFPDGKFINIGSSSKLDWRVT